VSLLEALTRRPPSGLGDPREAALLPADFSPAFRGVVARCVSPSPLDRPSVTELLAWAQGGAAGSAPVATTQPAPPEPIEPKLAPPQTRPPQVAPAAARPAPSVTRSPKPRALLTVILGAVVILALISTGVRVFRAHHTPAPPVQAPGQSLSQTPGAAATEARAPVSSGSTTKPGRSDLAASPSALHEVIPEVPRGARRTIRGHINVWVRVVVDQDGSVLAAVADRTGPSRYFQQLAIEAAKKWTFPPADTPSRRVMQVRFDFSRDGTTGRVVTLG
jgi:TonB family protein